MSWPPSNPQLEPAGADVLKEFVFVRLRRTALSPIGRAPARDPGVARRPGLRWWLPHVQLLASIFFLTKERHVGRVARHDLRRRIQEVRDLVDRGSPWSAPRSLVSAVGP